MATKKKIDIAPKGDIPKGKGDFIFTKQNPIKKALKPNKKKG